MPVKIEGYISGCYVTLTTFNNPFLTSLFNDQIIHDGSDPFDTTCGLTRFIDRLLRINEAAQLNAALVGFDTDPE